MKKILVLTLVALFLCSSALGQKEKKEKEKKEGGFLKMIESNTGLKVSKEALFVYPVIGEWKMAMVSCVGDRTTGEVVFKIKVTLLSDNHRMIGTRCLLYEAVATEEKTPFQLSRFTADPLYDFEVNKTVEITFQPILEVPEGTKTLDVKFYVDSQRMRERCFEARRIPIEWIN